MIRRGSCGCLASREQQLSLAQGHGTGTHTPVGRLPGRPRRNSITTPSALPPFMDMALAINDEASLAYKVGRIAAQEIQLESALHVSVAQSAQCMMKFGMTTDALKPAPALSADAEVSPTSVFDFARQQSLGHRHDFGACMATPPDFESKEARTTVRTGSSAVASALASSSSSQSAALRAQAAAKISHGHESMTIMDRYGDWVRRIRRRKRLETMNMLLSLFANKSSAVGPKSTDATASMEDASGADGRKLVAMTQSLPAPISGRALAEAAASYAAESASQTAVNNTAGGWGGSVSMGTFRKSVTAQDEAAVLEAVAQDTPGRRLRRLSSHM